MEILTLARFVLETSLMDYELLGIRDSKLAAACLNLALKMKNISEWVFLLLYFKLFYNPFLMLKIFQTLTLEYYSGYNAVDLENLVLYLNNMITQPTHKNLQTVRTKYSHK